MSAIISDAEVYIPLAELINLDDEIARLEKEVANLQNEVTRSEKKLGNERFVANAPEAVVAEERSKQADWQQKLTAATSRLAEVKASRN